MFILVIYILIPKYDWAPSELSVDHAISATYNVE